MHLPKPKWIILILALLYLAAIPVDTMDVDASQYASMSREMMQSGSYLQVFEQGRDYLDKPPFLFWLSSISMHLFGVNNFAFKFPSILFALLALYATYRLAKMYYEEQFARLAMLILGTTQALFLMTNDIKTDTVLMGWVALALWQLARWLETNNRVSFFIGCGAIAFGMMTKGPIALLVPVFSIGSQIFIKKEWRRLLNPILLAGLLEIAILLLPMSIGLYQQFDMHPEKTVNGAQGVSGLRFFYWTQSFGRITGESVWNNGASFTFLFENLLWGWLPWTFFMLAGFIVGVYRLFKNKFRIAEGEEVISLLGFIITYCSLGISKFQLPHYIYVVLPLAAIVTARPLYMLMQGNMYPFWTKVLQTTQWIVISVLLAFPFVLINWVFPGNELIPWVIGGSSIVTSIVVFVRCKQPTKILYASLAGMFGFNILLSTWFYPHLLQYQASNQAGRFVHAQHVPEGRFVMYQYKGNRHGLHFYSQQIVKDIDTLDAIAAGTWVLTGSAGKKSIDLNKRKYRIMKTGEDFHISMLTLSFLNAATRASVVDRYYVLRMEN